MTTFATLLVTILLLNAFNPRGMIPIDIGIGAFILAAWLIHRPRTKKAKKHPPTTEDVWRTIRSAQQTLQDSYDLIYGRKQ